MAMALMFGMGALGLVGGAASNERRLRDQNMQTAVLEAREAAVNQFTEEANKLEAIENNQMGFYSSETGKRFFNVPVLKNMDGEILANIDVDTGYISFDNYPNIWLDAREFCDNKVFHMGTSFLVENMTGPYYNKSDGRTADIPLYSNCSNTGRDPENDPITGNSIMVKLGIPNEIINDDAEGLERQISEDYLNLTGIQKIAQKGFPNSGYCETYNKHFNFELVQENLDTISKFDDVNQLCRFNAEDPLSKHFKYYMCTPKCTSRSIQQATDMTCLDGEGENNTNPFCKTDSPYCASAGFAPFTHKGFVNNYGWYLDSNDNPRYDLNKLESAGGDLIYLPEGTPGIGNPPNFEKEYQEWYDDDEASDTFEDRDNQNKYIIQRVGFDDIKGTSFLIPCSGVDMFGLLDTTSLSQGRAGIETTSGNIAVFDAGSTDNPNMSADQMITCTGTATVQGNWMGGTESAPATDTNCESAANATGVNNVYLWPGSVSNAGGCVGLPSFRLRVDPFYIPPTKVGDRWERTKSHDDPRIVSWRKDFENSHDIITLFNIYSSGLGNIDPEAFGFGEEAEFASARSPEQMGLERQINYFKNICNMFFGNRFVLPNVSLDIISSASIQFSESQRASTNNTNPLRQPLLWMWTSGGDGWSCNQWGGEELLWNVEKLNDLIFNSPPKNYEDQDARDTAAGMNNANQQQAGADDNTLNDEAAEDKISSAIYSNGIFFMENSGVYGVFDDNGNAITNVNTLFTIPPNFINVPMAIALYAFYQTYLELILGKFNPGASLMWSTFFAGSEISIGDTELFMDNGQLTNAINMANSHLGGNAEELRIKGGIDAQITNAITETDTLIKIFKRLQSSGKSYGGSIDMFFRLNEFGKSDTLICKHRGLDSTGKPYLCNPLDPNTLLKDELNGIPLKLVKNHDESGSLTGEVREVNCLSPLGQAICPSSTWSTVTPLYEIDSVVDAGTHHSFTINGKTEKYNTAGKPSRTYLNSYIKKAIKNAQFEETLNLIYTSPPEAEINRGVYGMAVKRIVDYIGKNWTSNRILTVDKTPKDMFTSKAAGSLELFVTDINAALFKNAYSKLEDRTELDIVEYKGGVWLEYMIKNDWKWAYGGLDAVGVLSSNYLRLDRPSSIGGVQTNLEVNGSQVGNIFHDMFGKQNPEQEKWVRPPWSGLKKDINTQSTRNESGIIKDATEDGGNLAAPLGTLIDVTTECFSSMYTFHCLDMDKETDNKIKNNSPMCSISDTPEKTLLIAYALRNYYPDNAIKIAKDLIANVESIQFAVADAEDVPMGGDAADYDVISLSSKYFRDDERNLDGILIETIDWDNRIEVSQENGRWDWPTEGTWEGAGEWEDPAKLEARSSLLSWTGEDSNDGFMAVYSLRPGPNDCLDAVASAAASADGPAAIQYGPGALRVVNNPLGWSQERSIVTGYRGLSLHDAMRVIFSWSVCVNNGISFCWDNFAAQRIASGLRGDMNYSDVAMAFVPRDTRDSDIYPSGAREGGETEPSKFDGRLWGTWETLPPVDLEGNPTTYIRYDNEPTKDETPINLL